MHDIIKQETPNHQLDDKQLNTDVHYFDAETASVLPLPPATTPTTTASSQQPAKCRLPLPSFSVDKSVSAATPVNEKIANVIRKRQSMSDSNRSQGCRIPMLCILQPVVEPVVEPVIEPVIEAPVTKQQRLRSVKSVKLPPMQKKSFSGTSESTQMIRKPLSRSNTVPIRMDQNMKSPTRQIKSPVEKLETKPSQKRASARSPLNDIKTNIRKPKITSPQPPPTQKAKKELPPKSSIYRHKRLPAGESRTARLMMGVSTTGRRQSFRQRDETSEKEVAPTLGLGSRLGKVFGKKDLESKKRPMSFAASSSSMLIRNNTEIPSPIKTIPQKDSPRSRRQSVPLPSTKMMEDPTKNKKSNNAIKNSIKALRVH